MGRRVRKQSILQRSRSFDQLETWAAAGEEVTAARGMHPDGWTAEAEPAASLKGASAIAVQADHGWTAEAEGEGAERKAAAAATALAAAAEATHSLRIGFLLQLVEPIRKKKFPSQRSKDNTPSRWKAIYMPLLTLPVHKLSRLGRPSPMHGIPIRPRQISR